jgi:hypothetical protein
MSAEQLVFMVFGLILGGLLLPLSSGKRAALWVALIIASAMAAAAGTMVYVTGLLG